MSTELIHNKTYAYRLPPTLIEQARHWANYHEAGVFSDEDINGVGNSKFYYSRLIISLKYVVYSRRSNNPPHHH